MFGVEERRQYLWEEVKKESKVRESFFLHETYKITESYFLAIHASMKRKEQKL